MESLSVASKLNVSVTLPCAGETNGGVKLAEAVLASYSETAGPATCVQ